MCNICEYMYKWLVGDGGVLLQNPQAHLMFVSVKMSNSDDSTIFYRPILCLHTTKYCQYKYIEIATLYCHWLKLTSCTYKVYINVYTDSKTFLLFLLFFSFSTTDF